MQISIRSQLIAGTAAVVGASAIAMTPVTQANLALSDLNVPSASQIALAGFDSPLSELIGTFNSFNQWLVSTSNTPAAYAALGGITGPGGYAIVTSPLGFNFNSIGLLPQMINDPVPVLRQVGLNGAASLESTLNSFTTIGLIASEAAWNLPGAFVTATQQALSGDIPGAIATLQGAIVTPFIAAGQVALDNGNYLLDNAVARGTALLNAVPELVNLVIQSSVGQATVLANTFSSVVQNIITGVTNGNAEQAWNAAVDGFLGPNGLPGTFLNLTVGAGVQVDAATVVPSIRGEIQAAVHGIATALSQTGASDPVPPPSAAAQAAATPSASAKRVAAVDASTSVDVSGSSAGKSGASNGGSAKGAHSKSGKSNAKKGVAGSKRAAKASAGNSGE